MVKGAGPGARHGISHRFCLEPLRDVEDMLRNRKRAGKPEEVQTPKQAFVPLPTNSCLII